jgi:uridine phosphorylase
MNADYPILEYDPDPHAILSPQVETLRGKLPSKAVMCFFQDVLHDQLEQRKLNKVGQLRSEIGENPVYTTNFNDQPITVLHAGDGASLAASFLDDLIAAGVKQVVVCGSCGALVEDIPAGHVLIPESAVRDEGTSYHYLPPSRECTPSSTAIKGIEETLKELGIPFFSVKTWTTDAFYRETVSKRERRIREGCRVVEMEAAALFAVAEFRKVELGMLLYTGDLVVPAGWQDRGWNERKDSRALLYELALQACSKL